MPNARVGAMPNTQALNEADDEGVGITRTKGRRQQGITMEVRSHFIESWLHSYGVRE